MDEQLIQLAHDLCHWLDSGWTVRLNGNADRAAQLVNGDMLIYVHEVPAKSGANNPHWHIAGSLTIPNYWQFKPTRDTLPTINVSCAKMSNQVAREINRRLLPDLELIAKTVRQRYDQDVQDKADAKRIALQLQPLMGNNGPYSHGDGYEWTNHAILSNNVRLELHVEGAQVNLSIERLPADQAELILHYVNALAEATHATPVSTG